MCKKHKDLVFGSLRLRLFEYPHGLLVCESFAGQFKWYFRYWSDVPEHFEEGFEI